MPEFAGSREQGVDAAHAWRLTITGALDAATVQPLHDAIDDVVELGARFVTLDLTDVTFLDSTGLRSIVRGSDVLADTTAASSSPDSPAPPSASSRSTD
jgi:anti-anti-sigma factor